MSDAITSGKYKIQNLLHQNRYTSMAGPDNNYEVVGHDVANIIEVEVVDRLLRLATLFDTKQNKYIHIDDEDNVVGRDEPQVLQLSTENGQEFIIHKQDINKACVLNSEGNWTPIVAEPAPPQGVEGWLRKYWKFVSAE